MSDDLKKIKNDKDFAAIQAELDAERERLLEERRKFEAEKAERQALAASAAGAAGIDVATSFDIDSAGGNGAADITIGAASETALKAQQAAEAATLAAQKAQKAADKAGRGRAIGGFLRGLILGLLAGAVAMFFLGKAYITKNYGTHTITEIGEENIIEEHFAGYTAIDFQDAILGEAVGHSELIVMEEPMQLSTTLLKEGPWEWEVFRRTKNVTYYGTGVYTVDLSKLNSSHVKVDEDSKKVTVTVPHAALQYVNPDYEKIEFEDTDMGLLAFTDIKLTAEEQAALENSVLEDMREHLSAKELMDSADQFAKMKIWELFQPLVTAVSPEFQLEVAFK